MKTKQKTFDALCDFIIREYWGKKEKMHPKTTLEKDLRITGDDGIEFLDKFLTHFNIDYEPQEGRPRYFDDEGSGLINFVAIFNWIRGKKDTNKQYDLTLNHLAKVIELGYWIDMEDKCIKE